MARAPLIAIEGLDRTGKTTQTSKLLSHLTSSKVKNRLIKFPDRTTPIGQLINKYLTDKQFELSDQSAHLLFSANRWELYTEIINSLTKESTAVVLDRYVYSGVAYSAAKGLDFQWCLNPDVGMPKPDVTIFLKLKDSKATSKREGYGDERYEVVEFQDKVRFQFEKFENESNWHDIYVDGKGIEEVEREIWSVIEPYINGVEEDLHKF
ncbi:DEKNAAC105442 [Brettanomyces naardenensis]|uniref:Thymidylate kinase n=1 Tax=Brettanomyces naardenensis TaxID=13370 RepID=A0A448YTJ9_BRENA|nr:DEKNAAC105442 [Brettanomyces naardenensis]